MRSTPRRAAGVALVAAAAALLPRGAAGQLTAYGTWTSDYSWYAGDAAARLPVRQTCDDALPDGSLPLLDPAVAGAFPPPTAVLWRPRRFLSPVPGEYLIVGLRRQEPAFRRRKLQQWQLPPEYLRPRGDVLWSGDGGLSWTCLGRADGTAGRAGGETFVSAAPHPLSPLDARVLSVCVAGGRSLVLNASAPPGSSPDAAIATPLTVAPATDDVSCAPLGVRIVGGGEYSTLGGGEPVRATRPAGPLAWTPAARLPVPLSGATYVSPGRSGSLHLLVGGRRPDSSDVDLLMAVLPQPPFYGGPSIAGTSEPTDAALGALTRPVAWRRMPLMRAFTGGNAPLLLQLARPAVTWLAASSRLVVAAGAVDLDNTLPTGNVSAPFTPGGPMPVNASTGTGKRALGEAASSSNGTDVPIVDPEPIMLTPPALLRNLSVYEVDLESGALMTDTALVDMYSVAVDVPTLEALAVDGVDPASVPGLQVDGDGNPLLPTSRWQLKLPQPRTFSACGTAYALLALPAPRGKLPTNPDGSPVAVNETLLFFANDRVWHAQAQAFGAGGAMVPPRFSSVTSHAFFDAFTDGWTAAYTTAPGTGLAMAQWDATTLPGGKGVDFPHILQAELPTGRLWRGAGISCEAPVCGRNSRPGACAAAPSDATCRSCVTCVPVPANATAAEADALLPGSELLYPGYGYACKRSTHASCGACDACEPLPSGVATVAVIPCGYPGSLSPTVSYCAADTGGGSAGGGESGEVLPPIPPPDVGGETPRPDSTPGGRTDPDSASQWEEVRLPGGWAVIPAAGLPTSGTWLAGAAGALGLEALLAAAALAWVLATAGHGSGSGAAGAACAPAPPTVATAAAGIAAALAAAISNSGSGTGGFSAASKRTMSPPLPMHIALPRNGSLLSLTSSSSGGGGADEEGAGHLSPLATAAAVTAGFKPTLPAGAAAAAGAAPSSAATAPVTPAASAGAGGAAATAAAAAASGPGGLASPAAYAILVAFVTLAAETALLWLAVPPLMNEGASRWYISIAATTVAAMLCLGTALAGAVVVACHWLLPSAQLLPALRRAAAATPAAIQTARVAAGLLLQPHLLYGPLQLEPASPSALSATLPLAVVSWGKSSSSSHGDEEAAAGSAAPATSSASASSARRQSPMGWPHGGKAGAAPSGGAACRACAQPAPRCLCAQRHVVLALSALRTVAVDLPLWGQAVRFMSAAAAGRHTPVGNALTTLAAAALVLQTCVLASGLVALWSMWARRPAALQRELRRLQLQQQRRAAAAQSTYKAHLQLHTPAVGTAAAVLTPPLLAALAAPPAAAAVAAGASGSAAEYAPAPAAAAATGVGVGATVGSGGSTPVPAATASAGAAADPAMLLYELMARARTPEARRLAGMRSYFRRHPEMLPSAVDAVSQTPLPSPWLRLLLALEAVAQRGGDLNAVPLPPEIASLMRASAAARAAQADEEEEEEEDADDAGEHAGDDDEEDEGEEEDVYGEQETQTHHHSAPHPYGSHNSHASVSSSGRGGR
jgi:hypothetical protein